MPYVVCAAPEYIRRHGAPAHPKELECRSCLIHLTQKRNPDEWFFADSDDRYSVKVRGIYRSNLESAVLLAAVEGLGIARLSEYNVRTELDAGQLVSIFDGTVQSGRTVKAFYNRSQYVPRKISAFVDLLHKRYKQTVIAH
jgi:DNA-binding transcriptional LysR family regulator